MALEMKKACEKCGRTLVAKARAYICIYECTFCGDCSVAMNSICPNCGGELVRRPRAGKVRPSISGETKQEINKRTIHESISAERDKIMTTTRQRADADAKQIGVEIIDVRLRRVELPEEVLPQVYQRMESERKRVANELRSQGAAESEKIRADADRQREVILADAYRQAQKVKGEGDAKSAGIYAAAYGQNPEFYSFYRSLETYKATFHNKNDLMVLDPNSEFFQYLKQSGIGKIAPRPGAK